MTDAVAQTPAVPPERVRRTFPLRDLGVAPENMRAGEPPDDDIPQLAETIFAAGVLQPLTVRPGRRKEKPGMALDGRRRLLALGSLLEAGRIGDDYPVDTFVETDPARQAAAVLLTNTAVPVHVADVIAAIGKMLKAKLDPATIAAALGYAEVEIRRLAALSGLHAKALQALKVGKITLRQAKLLARLPDKTAQAEIAEAVLSGYGFQEWRITERLDQGQVTVGDRRFALVGPERYAAAGGRTETDLFGERPDVLLDAEVLHTLWAARAEALSRILAAEGREIHVTGDTDGDPEGDLEPFGYAYGLGLDAAGLDAWREAQAGAQTAAAALQGRDLAAASADADIQAFLQASLAADQASEPARPVTFVQIGPGAGTGLEAHCYGPAAPEEIADEDDEDEAETPLMAGRTACRSPVVQAGQPIAAASAPELDGVGHALHEVRTDVATRALIRAVADDPGTALVALAARLFSVVVLRSGLGKGGGALTVHAEAYGRPRSEVIPGLDGDVRQRLADRRTAWEASGLTPIGWLAGLPHGEKMALLAELTALSLDLREERTTSLRRAARAEATELAALCGADVTLHWTPDERFLRAHAKPQLVAMLVAMEAPDTRAGALKKDELVALVAERAAARSWAPAYLSWVGAEPDWEEEGESETPETPMESDHAPEMPADGQIAA